MHIILYVFRPFNGFYGCILYVLPITYCLMQKHTPSMFLTDFRTRKYTRGIISWVGIFLTVTPVLTSTDIYHNVNLLMPMTRFTSVHEQGLSRRAIGENIEDFQML